MFSLIFRIIFLCLSLCLAGYGGFYVYQKQKYVTNHNSFFVETNYSAVYIPSVKQIVKKEELSQVISTLKMPEGAFDIFKDILDQKRINHDFSVQISYKDDWYVISFNGLASASFEKYFNTILPNTKKSVQILGKTVYHKTSQGYLALSNQPILINIDAVFEKLEGNADFFYSHDKLAKAYKLNNKQLFHTSIVSGDFIGKSVDPFSILSHCPNSADTLEFYGSTRFSEDARFLFGSKDSTFFGWVDEAVVFLKKDSFEIIVGKQNDQINLKNYLEEVTLSLSDDSLLPEKIYLNNFEIMPFDFGGDWKSVFPFLNSDLNYYSEYNNYIFLSKSLQGMYWLLRELQLGNTFEKNRLNQQITSKLNRLRIVTSASNFKYDIESKLKKGKHLNFQVSQVEFDTSLVLTQDVSSFSYLKSVELIRQIEHKIFLKGSDFIEMTDMSGEILWSKSFPNPIQNEPVFIDSDLDGQLEIIFSEGNNLHCFDVKGKALDGFPYTSNSKINQLLAVNYDNSTIRILMNTDGTIKNIDGKGKTVTGWSVPDNIGDLDQPLYFSSVNGFDFIFCTTSQDSILVFNRRGERRFPKIFKRLIQNTSPFVSGQSELISARLLGYSNQHIFNQYLGTGLLDSISTKPHSQPDRVSWIKGVNKNLLAIEFNDKLELYNEFGILENEIIKPVANSKLINSQSIAEETYLFFNLQTNKVYLLDGYGNLKHKTALNCSEIASYSNNRLITVVDKKVIVYYFK